MEPTPAKAFSVTRDGQPDGWTPPRGYRAQTAPDGMTRLVINVPPDELRTTHLRLLAALGSTLSVRYVRLTDRQTGQLPKPESYVRMDAPASLVMQAFDAAAELVWGDARHQLWVRGGMQEQVVLDELGVLYCYPDDPAFRDALVGVPQSDEVGIDGRDYVQVRFSSAADAQEATLLATLGAMKWG